MRKAREWPRCWIRCRTFWRRMDFARRPSESGGLRFALCERLGSVRVAGFAAARSGGGWISRGGKVKVADFASPYAKGSGVSALLDSLPHVLAADGFRAAAK